MIGIEFDCELGYADVLNRIFNGIRVQDYDFYISDHDILSTNEIPSIPHKTTHHIFEEFNQCAPYYVFFIDIKVFKTGTEYHDISNYDEYMDSACDIAIFIIDGKKFEIYAKEEKILFQFIKNAVDLKGTDITIKTKYSDGRTRFCVW